MSIWGRLLGGAAGFALGGPIGAILGVMAGSAFDRKKQHTFNFSKISQEQKQQIFTISFIVLAAKLAKSDGQVTDDEIRAFKEKFNVPKSELNKVGKIFNEAKKDVYGYKQIADQVGLVFSNNKILLEEMLNNLFFIAASDGQISLKEVELLRSISQSFSFDENTFQRIFQMNLKDNASDPYRVLDVSRDDTDQEIRKKWIQLNKEHHPDNLIARGMPKEFIEQSNKELAAINLAYDKIKEIELLRSISQSFSFDENTFQRIFQMNLNDNTSDPYRVLDVSRDDSDQEIRKKWIQLNKEHHPDNLIARGMPKEFIEQSNKELAAINLAYDKIKEIRAKS